MLLDNRLVLPPPQKFKVNQDLPTCASHVTIGMKGFSKSTYLLYAAAAALTLAATRQDGPQFGSETPFYISVCVAPTGEEWDELLGV